MKCKVYYLFNVYVYCIINIYFHYLLTTLISYFIEYVVEDNLSDISICKSTKIQIEKVDKKTHQKIIFK